jgi:nucleoside-diphosphate-sugar epimerase
MVVYGDIGSGQDPWEAVDEQSPLRSTNLYGLTKVLSEDIARYHAIAGAISTVALRLGMFVPETFDRYGFRLLFGGVDDRDVAQSVLLALSHRPEEGFGAYNIMADSGLTAADLPRLATNAGAVLDRHWPGTSELVRERRPRARRTGVGTADLPRRPREGRLGLPAAVRIRLFLECPSARRRVALPVRP